MRAAVRVAVAGVLVAALSGCLSLGPQEPQRYFVLEPSVASAAPARTARAATLLVMPTTAFNFYEIEYIAFSRAPGARAYYQFHSWTERPGRRVSELLVKRLERDGSFKAVAAATAGVHGNYVLNTHLTDFYHDAAAAPGSARVVLTAELVDSVRRVLLARRTFDRSAPAAAYDAAGAVLGFNQAVTAILEDVSAWVDATAPR
jgi:cholesterol transport system auxiliary component